MSNRIAKHIELNNQIMIQNNGQYQFEKDKEAVKTYFIEHINQNTVFFHNLKEKLDYLIENDYYEEEFLNKYTYKETKNIYDIAYAKKFRFPSFMSAFKFYNDYALKTNDKKKILERYEDRVAIVALYLANGNYKKAKKLVTALINQELQPSTPSFLNAGRKRRGELVSCFLMEVGDSLNDISKAIETSMQLSKLGGGVSLSLTKIRAKGEAIKGVENATKGVVGVMKLLDNAFRYADQMGQRQGSGAVYLNVFHADINDFLDTKKISADEDVRVKTLSVGVVIPDKFIELARDDRDTYVFYPHTVFKEYGVHLDDMDINEMYDKLVENPRIRKDKINPRKLLEKMASLRFESGYPYMMFEDNVNAVHALKKIGKVKFSNLCVEIQQLTKVSQYNDYDEEDILGMDVSCNLSSLNIVNVMENKSIQETVEIAMDALTEVAERTSIKNAPAIRLANDLMASVGLGAMNLHGFLAKNKIAYESEQARDFVNTFFMMVNYYSLKRSMEIAQETGKKFYRFEDSEYASGKYFEKYTTQDYAPKTDKAITLFDGIYIPTIQDWQSLCDAVMKYGLRNAYRLAIAPTGSISYVQSSTASVMPIMEKIEQRTYGNSKTYYPMPYLSPETWFFYKEAYDMDMFRVVDMIATIQEHIDQAISFTLFMKDTHTTRDLNRIDLYAHHKGIKTLYYARTKDTSRDDCLSCSV
ncbi:class 1b ribonucleoside-diphosphate reductase subunit alpha [Paenibacillus polymyxa]|uniref:Ribonucleoside-diphosphate reductase n=2 Tax=Paenibacillus polymyxa TaxID=1406 RepID=A0A378Y1C8_PAEPO|nr:class 1b ribonucleoside-diphosphate reductase subunit alpha [Paenibacillus polymyxa]UOD84422.1 class 1b ribonucleoside-diphosphate reductase subunit alpha [Paenibacillus polymyxa ATCC 842]MBE7896080.1 class 1b ribonucleoside-diphosphate reductase subunit alpha [Paenibacillus polymyxa]QPK54898.1 class 1b ribonucleoside-diphosphate reductase subunit alpha [Paenibacillus polymyxa]QPK59986.1 class 1b ribonucleoside-diphosphate reductase subunit alpha [Paenibacillus polymyxa]WEK65530.1 class 1b 